MGSDQPHPNKYEEIIEGFKTNKFKNITFITGAGISTSAGIPDFRSPTGIFANVKKKYGLNRPEDLFELNSFLDNPKPFYDFCKEFNIEHCLPTKTHLFQSFLCHKGLVNKIYTQNVDGLELKAGCPENKIIFAHGRITEAGCPKCFKSYDIEKLRENINKDILTTCSSCGAYIKPKVVFYNESLSFSFYFKFISIKFSDLGIIMGTSLRVFPFGNLPYSLPKSSWRVLINMEEAGYMSYQEDSNAFRFNDINKKDLFLQGKCDEVIDKLVRDIGWEQEFNNFCNQRLSQIQNK